LVPRQNRELVASSLPVCATGSVEAARLGLGHPPEVDVDPDFSSCRGPRVAPSCLPFRRGWARAYWRPGRAGWP